MPQTAALYTALHRGGRYHYLWRAAPTRKTVWRLVEEPLPDVAGLCDVYFGVHPTASIPDTNADGKPVAPELVRGRIECISSVCCLFSEVDGKDFDAEDPLGRGLVLALAHIKSLPLQPTGLVGSGGGYHGYWVFREPWLLASDTEREAARALQAAWVLRTGGDPGAKDLARVLRVPGTVNTKYPDGRTVTLEAWNPDLLYERKDFEVLLQAEVLPLPAPVGPLQLGGNGKPPLADRLLADAVLRAIPGAGDDTGIWLACQLRDNRIPEGDAHAALMEFGARATADPTHPFTERDANRWWRSANSKPAREPWGAAVATEEWPEFEAVSEAVPRDQVSLLQQPLTDLGNAERLLALFGQDLRYVPPWRSWMVWNGQVWTKDAETAKGSEFGNAYRMTATMVRRMGHQMKAEIEKAEASDTGKEVAKALRSHIKSCEQHTKLSACLSCASHFRAISYEDLDAHPHLLPVANGTVDLRDGKLLPHDRAHLITHQIDVPYDPSALCPAWDAFMESIFPQGEELVSWVWRALGYALTGEVSERCVFFLWGTGRNGKSTLLEALADLLGEYAACIDSKVILVRRFDDGSSHELAQLPGKRYVFTSETGSGKDLNEARVKTLSGADTIQACAKYEQPFSFRPQFKLFLSTNHKPAIRGTDLAIWDRIRLIPFIRRFYTAVDELLDHPDALPADKHLREKLRAEFPGALARCVRAAREWYEFGLGTNEHVTSATETYRKDSDVLGGWLRENCETGQGLEARSSELWASYGSWCEHSGENKGTRKSFGLALKERGFNSIERGRHDRTHWIGLKLVNQEEPEFPAYEPGSEG